MRAALRSRAVTAVAAVLVCLSPTATARQVKPAAPAELSAVIEAIVTRPAQGTPRPDPAALLARVRAMDTAGLSFDEQIDRRFAETILVGRLVAAPAANDGRGRIPACCEQHLLP
jgi:hypothetical protein